MPFNNNIVPQAKSVSMPKSTFKRSVGGFASMNFGRVYPIFTKWQEAHSRIAMDLSSLIRGATPISPTMGNAEMEYHAFAVPWRIIWNYTKQFFGENDTSAWTQSNNYTKPQVELRIGKLYFKKDSDSTWTPSLPSGTNYDLIKICHGISSAVSHAEGDFYVDCLTSDCYGPNKLADYLGLHPIPKDDVDYTDKLHAMQQSIGSPLTFKVDALPFRAFFSIVNYYYRDQNYQSPYLFTKDNSDLKLGLTATESSRLPMPYDFMQYRYIGTVTHSSSVIYEGSAFCPPASRLKDPFSTIVPEPMKGTQFDLLSIAGLAPVVGEYNVTTPVLHELQPGGYVFGDSQESPFDHAHYLGLDEDGALSVEEDQFTADGTVYSSNLVADLTSASKITLAKFREWVLTNQWQEKAVKGTRYAEILQEFYGVPVNPAMVDEPRFLGGVKVPISSWQVTQTAPNADGSGVGDLSAFTHTKDDSNLFVFDFDEPSILMICAVARVEHNYSQQTDPHWFRLDKFDEHYPMFDGIGYQPLEKRVAFLPHGVVQANGGTMSSSSTHVLGFQEAYWEERYQLGNSAGVLNASNPYSLDYFVYNERLRGALATNSFVSAFEDAAIVDSTLQLGSQASLYAQQLLCNFSFNYTEAKMISLSGRNPGLERI